MEPGLYLTFFTSGEAFEKELPPVGPLDNLVVRDGALLADRKAVHQTDDFEGGSRWIEAELELQRALGNEQGGTRRPDLRVGAPEGVYLRFASFGDVAEHEPVPELGPYAVVVVTRDAVEADGDVLATRTGTKHKLWELTSSGGTALVGILRPDIAFRTRSTVYHPRIHQARPRAPAPPPKKPPAPAPVLRAPPTPRAAASPPPTPIAPKPEPAAPTAPPSPASASQRPEPAAPRAAPDAAEMTLRTRIGWEQRLRAGEAGAAESPQQLDFGSAAWRLRFAIIGALVVLVAAFSVPTIRGLLSPGTTTTVGEVGIGKEVAGPRWSYSVTSVRRMTAAGTARPRGTYLVVQLVAVNRGQEGAQIAPGDFSLIDSDGNAYAPLPASSNVYHSTENPSSPFVWTVSYPVGRSAATPLIFDVSVSTAGSRLVILEVPATRIRLD
ncbi:MAG TPA: hypothetical protein VGR87_10595 [Candidatus Limnocylindria bacterium]|nr:hypothetical protein [Candidatus Limnocylindria bacterium]